MMKKRSTRAAKAAQTEYYSSGHVAGMLGVTSRTVANWCDRGLLEFVVTPAGHRRIPAAAVQGLQGQGSRPAKPRSMTQQGRSGAPASGGKPAGRAQSAEPKADKSKKPKPQPPSSGANTLPRQDATPADEQDAGRDQVAILTLWLRVENNNKFVRGKKRAREAIEDFVLPSYGARKLRETEYELRIAYRDQADLDRQIYDMLSEMDSSADGRYCFIEADVHEEATGRSW